MHHKIIIPSLFAIAGISANAVAEENDSSFALGLGVGYEESIYKGVDSEVNALPLIAYEKGNFFIHGPEMGYVLYDQATIKAGIIGSYRMEGYEAGDSDDLAGMKDRDGTVELVFFTENETGYGDWSLSALADVGGKHKGYEIELGWEKDVDLSPGWTLTPEISVAYQSEDLNNYYYGVTADEATASRADYTADSDIVYEFGLSGTYAFDENQMVRLGVSYNGYGSEITDSSIVDGSGSASAGIVYLYRF